MGSEAARALGLPQVATPVAKSLGNLAQAANTSPEFEKKIAAAQQLEIERRYRVSRDRELRQQLNLIAVRLGNAGDTGPYSIQVIPVQSDEVNAFTPGAGLIYVTTGLVGVLPTEAQMAMTLAHEIGHIEQSHVANGLRAAILASVGADAARSALRGTGVSPKITQAALNTTFSVAVNGYTRAQESSADLYGLELMVAAGYDPDQAAKTFELAGGRWRRPVTDGEFLSRGSSSQRRPRRSVA